MRFSITIFPIFFLLFFTKLHGQTTIKEALAVSKNLISQEEIDQFYATASYRPVWINRPRVMEKFLQLLAAAPDFALVEKDYQFNFIQKLKNKELAFTGFDSLQADIILTDAAIHFFKELKKGNQPPLLRYQGLKYAPDVSDIVSRVMTAIESDMLFQLAVEIQPSTTEYLKMMSVYRNLREEARMSVEEERITSKKVSGTNKPLLIKLFRLALIDSVDGRYGDKDILQKLRVAQRMFNLIGDGILKPITLSELNISMSTRIAELATAINYLRWLQGLKNDYVAIVNLPSASLYVYRNMDLVFDSKLIVGKPSTPTPTLSSSINEVILYPYWNVPYKIATRELLPSIKRNRGYLAANNFQVLDKSGRIVNPYSINWWALSPGYFPYTIRQSTGCDNSLGIIKFNFYNPFTVYLHDTPAKGLFNMNKRFFSHGCMRVEKPVEFGQMLLGKNRIAIDTLTIKGCLLSQAPKPVATEQKLPVVVMYSTAWYDPAGNVIFFGDIYNKN